MISVGNGASLRTAEKTASEGTRVVGEMTVLQGARQGCFPGSLRRRADPVTAVAVAGAEHACLRTSGMRSRGGDFPAPVARRCRVEWVAGTAHRRSPGRRRPRDHSWRICSTAAARSTSTIVGSARSVRPWQPWASRLRPTISVGAPCSTTSEPLGDLDQLPETRSSRSSPHWRSKPGMMVPEPWSGRLWTKRARDCARSPANWAISTRTAAPRPNSRSSGPPWTSTSGAAPRPPAHPADSLSRGGRHSHVHDDGLRGLRGDGGPLALSATGTHRGRTPAVPASLFEHLARARRMGSGVD